VFNHAGCERLTSRPLASNLRHCRMLEKAGFKQEAVLSDYYQEGNAVQYRLLKRQCRWLNSD
jgi:RimJ/RimL family protein N-acetyltransferase